MKLVFLLAAAIAIPAWAGGDASDGHTHAAPAPIPVTPSAPRAVAATEDFEVVAVLEGRQLVIYVDRFASNEPVAGAKVEIEGGGLKGVAAESAPGVYAIDAAAMTPARHPLTISIEAGDSVDLLSATLDVAPPQAGVAHVHGLSEWASWLGAAVLALTALVLLVIRRRKKRKGSR